MKLLVDHIELELPEETPKLISRVELRTSEIYTFNGCELELELNVIGIGTIEADCRGRNCDCV
jgi:hypothetical protein